MGNCCQKKKGYSDINKPPLVNIRENPRNPVRPKEDIKNNGDPEEAIFNNFEPAKHGNSEANKADPPRGYVKPPQPKKETVPVSTSQINSKPVVEKPKIEPLYRVKDIGISSATHIHRQTDGKLMVVGNHTGCCLELSPVDYKCSEQGQCIEVPFFCLPHSGHIIFCRYVWEPEKHSEGLKLAVWKKDQVLFEMETKLLLNYRIDEKRAHYHVSKNIAFISQEQDSLYFLTDQCALAKITVAALLAAAKNPYTDCKPTQVAQGVHHFAAEEGSDSIYTMNETGLITKLKTSEKLKIDAKIGFFTAICSQRKLVACSSFDSGSKQNTVYVVDSNSMKLLEELSHSSPNHIRNLYLWEKDRAHYLISITGNGLFLHMLERQKKQEISWSALSEDPSNLSGVGVCILPNDELLAYGSQGVLRKFKLLV